MRKRLHSNQHLCVNADAPSSTTPTPIPMYVFYRRTTGAEALTLNTLQSFGLGTLWVEDRILSGIEMRPIIVAFRQSILVMYRQLQFCSTEGGLRAICGA